MRGAEGCNRPGVHAQKGLGLRVGFATDLEHRVYGHVQHKGEEHPVPRELPLEIRDPRAQLRGHQLRPRPEEPWGIEGLAKSIPYTKTLEPRPEQWDGGTEQQGGCRAKGTREGI